MSPDQLLSHLFKALTVGKTIVEVIPDSPDAQSVQIQTLNIDGLSNQKPEIRLKA